MTTDTLTVDQQMIVEALGELKAARADWTHSPNSDTALTVEYAEMRFNRLLDRYCPCEGVKA